MTFNFGSSVKHQIMTHLRKRAERTVQKWSIIVFFCHMLKTAQALPLFETWIQLTWWDFRIFFLFKHFFVHQINLLSNCPISRLFKSCTVSQVNTYILNMNVSPLLINGSLHVIHIYVPHQCIWNCFFFIRCSFFVVI